MKGIELYFFRHGIAVDRGDPAVSSDRDRPLTDEGMRKTRAAAEGLRRLESGFDGLLTSPWLRAVQTAEILADVLQLAADELPELAGDRTPDELLTALAGQQGRRIVLVGHEPLLGNTIGRLICGSAPFRVDLKKSGLCAVRVQGTPTDEGATLLWLLTSKQLRMIGKS
jgi:phosphohistidine phosphatase